LLTKTAFRNVIENSIQSINQGDWSSVVGDRNIYLSIPYLRALEKTTEHDIDIFYAMTYNEVSEPVMVAVYQLVIFEYRKNDHPKAILRHFHNEIVSQCTFWSVAMFFQMEKTDFSGIRKYRMKMQWNR